MATALLGKPDQQGGKSKEHFMQTSGRKGPAHWNDTTIRSSTQAVEGQPLCRSVFKERGRLRPTADIEREVAILMTSVKLSATKHLNKDVNAEELLCEQSAGLPELYREGDVHKCEICKKSFSRTYNLSEYAVGSSTETMSRCEMCATSLTPKCSAVQRFSGRVWSFACNECKRGFTGRVNLENHIRSVKLSATTHLIEDVNAEERLCEQSAGLPDLYGEGDVHTCEICKKSFSRRNNLSEYVVGSSREAMTCCEMCVTQLTPKRSEAQRFSGRISPFACNVCKRSCTGRANLENHIRVSQQQAQNAYQGIGENLGTSSRVRTSVRQRAESRFEMHGIYVQNRLEQEKKKNNKRRMASEEERLARLRMTLHSLATRVPKIILIRVDWTFPALKNQASVKLNSADIEAIHVNKDFNVKELLLRELLNTEENFNSCRICKKSLSRETNLLGHSSGMQGAGTICFFFVAGATGTCFPEGAHAALLYCLEVPPRRKHVE
ncbi:zinc finger protein 660-like [Cryptotermes secundus]|uniref:zinc finger protein 660-like n=1 Tax=Cryptotermes secundus TaxID=105785 RepID=UPI000CD7DB2F|nr:zinc finger protein 660-like [Cryptotermes secundus]